MKFRFVLLSVLVPGLIAGCNSFQPKTPGATFDRIGQEMQDAVSAKSKGSEDALSQAMMPPLQLDLPASATMGLIARARLSIATLSREVRDLVIGVLL